jgi:phosphate transport system permease protein
MRTEHKSTGFPSPTAFPNPLERIRLSEQPGDRVFRCIVLSVGCLVIVLAGAIGLELILKSKSIWKEFGPSFLWASTWDPVEDIYGALPFIYGTLVSSALALFISIPLGIGSAIFLSEMVPSKISNALTFLIELLAAVPSVILGLMGIFVLVPAVGAVQPFLIKHLGFIPLFSGHAYGVCMFTAGLVLSVMILPYITSISRDVIMSVPLSLKEAILSLGATKWEVVKNVVLPYARSGILGSVFLALGRALGETMAVTMVIGNAPKISASLFDPAYTMAAVIANEFAEATSDLNSEALIAIGLSLFGITIIVNGFARLMIYKTQFKTRSTH